MHLLEDRPIIFHWWIHSKCEEQFIEFRERENLLNLMIIETSTSETTSDSLLSYGTVEELLDIVFQKLKEFEKEEIGNL